MSRNSGGTRRGAYVDSKGVRWDPNDADYEGILYKQSKWMKGLEDLLPRSTYYPRMAE